jgi:ribosomal protein L7/L12
MTKGVVPMSDEEIFELKQRVTRLESQMALLLRNLGIAYLDMPAGTASPEVMELLRLGQKIEAIKRFREETGAGLKDAKEFIKSLEG